MSRIRRAAIAFLGAAGLLLLPVAAQADARGCNYSSCIYVKGDASNYGISATTVAQGGTLYGHFHLWGPNVDYTGPNQNFTNGIFTPEIHGYGAGKVCAEFFTGAGESDGLACETVS